jgi:3-hexulose-6-phosphate synthase
MGSELATKPQEETMRLQLALDTFELATAITTLYRTRGWVDIAEVGTGLGISEGAAAIREIKSRFPDLTVLSDIKVMDGGESLVGFALDAGADIVSVLGVTDDATVAAAIGAARARGKEVLVDMIGVQDISTRARTLDELGAHYICVHTPYDLRDSVLPPTDDLVRVQRAAEHARKVVSGGIKLEAIDRIVGLGPDVVVVGSAIMGAEDQALAAKSFWDAVHGA